MATVYVIHAEGDAPLVQQRVLRGLPSNGYDCWLARHHFASAGPEEHAIVRAMDKCQVILILLSPAILGSPGSMEEIDIALAGRRTLIVVQIAAFGEQGAARLPARLWALPKVDLTVEKEGEAERLLAGLLPPVDGGPETVAPKDAERIEWNEEVFSAALAGATARHDHAAAESLVATIFGHLAHRSYAYPPQHAYKDLQRLRQEREFELMRRYGEAVIASGTRQDRVRRLLGQALIETGQYDRALEFLQSIIDDPDSSQGEIFEARGLIGRTFKQRYMDAPDAPEAAELLRRAISAYETAYVEDPRNFWHGVNAASCILRAARDGIAAAPPERAQEIAQQIAQDLEQLSQKGRLYVWDCASRVEALLALDRYDEAEQALDVYIHHPDMMAFEVSSTFRQFDQVLNLGRTARGKALLARLRSAMERYRAGKVAARPAAAADQLTESAGETARTRPLVIRLGDPAWDPKGVTDLVIQSRLGKIVTARGSDASVRELLTDSMVISIEESRPAGQFDCDRSLPFIRATAHYDHPMGPYTEMGDRALIAIIDNGVDILHKAFLDADGNPRIVGIWDQTASGGVPPQGFSYGTFHDAAAIAGYVKTGAVPPSLGRNERGHGTHVASIAGGRAAGDFAGGIAPDAKLLIVVSASSGPIGYSRSHIEALTFINTVAEKLDLPVVVNVSQGMNAGAHDGKSSLEVAFDAFSESGRRQGRVVVKSAGNERDKGGHARVTLKTDSLEKLRWIREPGADYAARIELWWSSADEIEFRLGEPVPPVNRVVAPDPPDNWSNWVGTAAPECEGRFPKGGPFRLVFTKRHIDNGDSMLLIELGNATGEAALGDWLLEIHGVAIKEGGEVHCWIERSQGLPTSFQYPHVSEDMTLSIPGTAQSVIAVGAVDACKPIQVGAFSSYGPTRDKQNKPLVCAPGVNVNAAQGGTDHDVFSYSGTSMAAPHVTGAIALLLSRAAKLGKIPGGNQIASALRQKTQNYDGQWDRGQGYGVIDVSALLAAFD
jgi:subtilisin family serine protease/tetratricopeptide (TPR) repeat protein